MTLYRRQLLLLKVVHCFSPLEEHHLRIHLCLEAIRRFSERHVVLYEMSLMRYLHCQLEAISLLSFVNLMHIDAIIDFFVDLSLTVKASYYY